MAKINKNNNIILEEKHEVCLCNEDRNALLESFENPPKPNKTLKDLFGKK